MPLRILFADDSMTAQNMGKKILTEAGYEVVAVSNGAAAVKKIAEHKPDIIILDVYMPGYSGLEVCEKVRASIETMKTPVLLTVGKMEPYKSEDANRVKADGVIIKPFEASDLLAIVKKLEERIVPAAVPPLVQQTIRLDRPPDFSEFAVHSTGNSGPVAVAAVAAPDLGENTVQPTVDVPDHMATVSAFSDLLGTDTLAPVEFSAPAAPERPVEIAPAAVSPDPSATFTSIPEIDNGTPFAAEHPSEIAPAAGLSPDHSATFTSIPEIENGTPFTSAVEVVQPRPQQQDLGAPAGLHSDFAVTPEPASVAETAQQFETATFLESIPSESVAVESTEVDSIEVAAPSADVAEILTSESSPQPSSTVSPEGVYPDTQPIPVYEEPESPAAHIQLEDVRSGPAAQALTEEMSAQSDPAFQPTQAETVAVSRDGIEPGLEPTIQPQPEVSLVADPNLVTERAALDSFPTTFGVQNPEEIPVGIASDLPVFDTQAGEQETAEAEAVESRDVAGWQAHSAPASPDADFEARVAAAMNVYAEPAEAQVDQPHESDRVEASASEVAVPEDDFEARVAAAMSVYEEPQATAAFADEMQSLPVHEVSETSGVTIPAEANAAAEPRIVSLPEFQSQVEIAPVQVEPIQVGPVEVESVPVAAEAPVSFEYSPPVTETRVRPEPKVEPEPQVEHTALDQVEVVADQALHLHHDSFAAPIQNEPVAYIQPIADIPVPDVGYITAPNTTAPNATVIETPQAGTEQIATNIEAEMPVEAMAAAAVGTGADSDAIAQVVHRVMERIKPELIAAIVRELNSQK